MTVIRPLESEVRGCQVEEMLQKHWGSTHTIKVFREPSKSLGISIVGGKVDLHSAEKSSDTFLGIFIKNVVPNSPAGKTGKFKTGDRILEVSGIDLRQATHEKAVQAIRNATNPVTFVIQSLIPWKISENDAAFKNNVSSSPSPYPSLENSYSTPVQTIQTSQEFNSNQSNSKTKVTALSIPNQTQSTSLAPVPKQQQNDISPLAPSLTHNSTLFPRHLDTEDAQSTSDFATDEEILVTQKATAADESDEGSDDEEEDDVRELEGRTVSARGQQIDRASAANVKRSKEEVAADLEQEDDFGYTSSIQWLWSLL